MLNTKTAYAVNQINRKAMTSYIEYMITQCVLSMRHGF